MVTTVIGGLGSDTFNVAGEVTETIYAAELEGRSSVINHGVRSNDPGYNGLLAGGIDLNVAGGSGDPGDTVGKVVIQQSGGATIVGEDVDPGSGTYVDSDHSQLAGVTRGVLENLTETARDLTFYLEDDIVISKWEIFIRRLNNLEDKFKDFL
ncbi:hypothetical protein LCGC14_3056160 [marine sediment metagenome]|uniref:Uncharacterized protein n=1 Tax=marine sediment metagenome TaxID=412755 RepID=A0A0F8YT25_9ZZZZ